ncbi:MAG: amino acid ABC transporter permease [Christensenellales bacterium]|nr:amino acid ABC transporter permease [Christensenellales bacterium]
MDFGQVFVYLLDGFRYTCLIFFFTLLFSLPLGLLMSFCSMSKIKIVRIVMKIIVWIIRGIPLMLQIFMIYYLPGLLGTDNMFAQVDLYFIVHYGLTDMGRFLAVIIAFSINYAAYFSEIFRGGIESIPRGQYEAAQVLGMTRSQIFFRIILPQVTKRILPPMSNEIITLVKDTALSRVILISELIMQAEKLLSQALIWPLFFTGVFYLVFVGILTLIFRFAEKKLSYYKV